MYTKPSIIEKKNLIIPLSSDRLYGIQNVTFWNLYIHNVIKSQWTIQKIPVDIGHTIAAKLKDRILDTENKKNVDKIFEWTKIFFLRGRHTYVILL